MSRALLACGLAGLAIVLTWLLAARPPFLVSPSGSPARIARVAYLDNAKSSDPPLDFAAFADELQRLGYVLGRDIQIEEHYGETARAEQLQALADEVVRGGADVIVSFGTQASQAAQRATCDRRIPVVSSGSDPVGAGLVLSLARPGQRDEDDPTPPRPPVCPGDGEWNITGLASGAKELAAKRLELLDELLPNARLVAVLWNPNNAGDLGEWQETQAAASRLGLRVLSLEVSDQHPLPPEQQIVAAFHRARAERVDAVAVVSSTILNSNSKIIVDCAAWAQLPAIYGMRLFAERGGLMSYGPDFAERYRRAAVFVDRILKGTKPAELSVEKAQRFELVVNSWAVQQLGLTIPRSLRVQVDEVRDRPPEGQSEQPKCSPP